MTRAGTWVVPCSSWHTLHQVLCSSRHPVFNSSSFVFIVSLMLPSLSLGKTPSGGILFFADTHLLRFVRVLYAH
jgi:hypothetical protein